MLYVSVWGYISGHSVRPDLCCMCLSGVTYLDTVLSQTCAVCVCLGLHIWTQCEARLVLYVSVWGYTSGHSMRHHRRFEEETTSPSALGTQGH